MQYAQKSISGQKVKAYAKILQADESFWHGFLVFIGALAVLSAIPFYPIILVPALALVCGAVAYRYPALGTILSVLLALPSFAYQSPEFGFLFLLVVAITLFEAFEHWAIISGLEALVFLPFMPFPLSLLGGFVILGLIIMACNFGSSKTLLVSIPAVFLILFLSSIWVQQNSAHMPLNLDAYQPALETLQKNRPAVDILSIPSETIGAFSSMATLSFLGTFNETLGKATANTITLLLADSGLIQLVFWSFVLYAASFLSGRIRGKHAQLISSSVLLLIPLEYYFLSQFFNYQFQYETVFYIIASIAIIGVLEAKNMKFSQEGSIMKKEKLKSFGKFGVKDLSLEGGEKFDDVGGYEDVKEEIRDAVMLPLEKKDLAYTYGLTPPKGILLFGPPGTGKTMIVRALANEISFRLYYVNTSELLSKWYGESEKNIAELFADARRNAPCIIMFDEIDSIGKSRSGYNDDVTPRVLSVLLQEIDGAVSSGKPVMIIGTTNIPNELDAALLRPGRFDKIIYMPLPDKEARKQIFKVYAKKYPSEEIDFEKLAKKTERFSGADIKNIVDEAVKIIAKEAGKKDMVVPLTAGVLLDVVGRTKPSVSLAHLEDYERFRMDFERRMGGKGEKAQEESEPAVKWQDVAGLEDVKRTLLETIQIPLMHEELMKQYKVKPSKGILLFGPPGCGKTLIVRAASGELKAAFITVSGAELVKRGFTQSVSVLKEAFMRAKENTPAILFIDEIETIAPSRARGGGDIVGQLLTEMDGMKELKGVVVIGATNKPDILDPAILRPGRFDKIFYIPPPDLEGRKQVFQINLGDFSKGVDLERLAQETEGFSGADISSLVQSAKMEALREKIKGGAPRITTAQLLKILEGRRPSITDSMLDEYQKFVSEYGERR
ncbi:MAG: AAA family ATPase [Candidatus Micrarchaeia archaeon]